MITASDLRQEAARHRAIAEKFDSLADVIDQRTMPAAPERKALSQVVSEISTSQGEFRGLTQRDAIVEAISRYGPQTTRELFDRLNAEGQNFKEVAYISAILARLRDKLKRGDDGRIYPVN